MPNKEYQYLSSLEKFGMNFGLQRIKHLLEKLNNPHRKFKSFHIAGTNGKGSTAAMLASILQAAGYKVGLYTSPHLLDVKERIKINGKNISQQEFLRGIKLIRGKIGHKPVEDEIVGIELVGAEDIQPLLGKNITFFEFLTALAFWYFAKEKVDYAVIEVGLGGRLDATNVITPLVSIITNIDYEHTEILGKTLKKIAYEKAGIVKPNVTLVTAETKPVALRVMNKICKKNGALFYVVRAEDIQPLLLGPHQRTNAACALAALKVSGIKVSASAVRKGLLKVRWPGRFEIVSKKPLIILDGAHNPAGAKALRVTIKRLFPQQKFTVIFGMQNTKDYRQTLDYLVPITEKLIITRSANRQAAATDKLADYVRDKVNCVQTASIEAAYKKWEKQSPLLVTGSLFLVGEAIPVVGPKHSR